MTREIIVIDNETNNELALLEYLPKNDERIILGRRENKKEYSVVEIVHYPDINNIFVFVEERENCYLDKIHGWFKTYRDEYEK